MGLGTSKPRYFVGRYDYYSSMFLGIDERIQRLYGLKLLKSLGDKLFGLFYRDWRAWGGQMVKKQQMGYRNGKSSVLFINTIIRLQVKEMGLQCAKPLHQGLRGGRDSQNLSVPYDMCHNKEMVTFQIKINNLRIVNLSQRFENIKIYYSPTLFILVPRTDFSLTQNIFSSNGEYQACFSAQVGQISSLSVGIVIEARGGVKIDELKMKLLNVSTGPVKHSHLLKETKSRLHFDFHIDQQVQADILLDNIEVQWKNRQQHQEYTYSLSLIQPNSGTLLEACKKYQKHQKTKNLAIKRFCIRNTQLKESVLRFWMISGLCDGDSIEIFIPYSKIYQSMGFKQVRIDDIMFQIRELKWKQMLVIKGAEVGQVKFNLVFMKSKLYAQQIDCVMFSENGIVIATPRDMNQVQKGVGRNIIEDFQKNLKDFKTCGIDQYHFLKVLQKFYTKILDKQLDMTDDMFRTQETLLNIMIELSKLLQTDKELRNDYIWDILNELCRKQMLTLQYFSSIKCQDSKRTFSLKFYKFAIETIIKIIELTSCGLSLKEVQSMHKFIAFVYFRFPWSQQQIIMAISNPDDPVISEEKLQEIGASYSMKSPSRAHFYDWQSTVFKLARKQPQFLHDLVRLQCIKQRNKNWALLLFDRQHEQLFYGLYSELWDQAFIFLRNNGRTMWQYFPRYGQLLSIFIGEMNNSEILDISKEMTRCNMKLIQNQKLLNTFMMLIFPKTYLYETYSVLKCLDLIKCYFNVVLNSNKKLPGDFHYNYFYIGIRCILQSNHSLLLQKMLAIIYKFYGIFADDFKEMINNYILNKVFFQLFMHWSQEVRSIFHLLLFFKIICFEFSQNPESSPQKNKQIYRVKYQYDALIGSLYRLQARKEQEKIKKESCKMQYFQKMKATLQLKKNKRIFLNIYQDDSNQSETSTPRKGSISILSSTMYRRKWSMVENFEQQKIEPTTSQLKYLHVSLRQFQQAKKQVKPDQKVQIRSKMLQVHVDE